MAGPWPEGARCVVLLTFDLDGPTPLLARDPSLARRPSVLSEGEFGPKVGAWRVLDLLGRFGVPATFFVPGAIVEQYPDLVRAVAERGHEVGHHGYLHEAPASLEPAQEVEVLERGLEALERVLGRRPVGYRAPFWDLSERTLDLLAERGLLYDSSLMDRDTPYTLTRQGRTLVELPVHWSLDDAPYWNYQPAVRLVQPPSPPEAVYNAWAEAFLEVWERRGYYCLTLHPERIGRPGCLRVLERLLVLMQSKPGTRFLRCGDLARWCLQA